MKASDLTVSDLMTTNLITIRASEPLKEARADMEVGVIRHLPVIDDRGRLVGVVSDRDLLASRRAQRVADVMTREVITTRADAPAVEAATTMLDNKISSSRLFAGPSSRPGPPAAEFGYRLVRTRA